MNPPYGRQIGRWVQKAYESATKGATVCCLVPARTDTRWWHRYVMRAEEVRLLRGRLKFGAAKNAAPFPSAIVVFRPPRPAVTSIPAEKGLAAACCPAREISTPHPPYPNPSRGGARAHLNAVTETTDPHPSCRA